MPPTRLTKFELQIMDVFWARGACSVREIQEAFPEAATPSLHDDPNHGVPAGNPSAPSVSSSASATPTFSNPPSRAMRHSGDWWTSSSPCWTARSNL